MELTELEKELFKAITGLNYDPIHHEGSLNELSAKAAAAYCEKKMREAWGEGYSDGQSDATSYDWGRPKTTKNPYLPKDLTEQKTKE